MFKPKAAIFDIDGTLFDYRHHHIPPSALTALQQLRQQGVTIVVASGRAYSMLPAPLRALLHPDYYVLSNGHSVLDAKEAVLVADSFSAAQTQMVVDLCQEHEAAFLLNYAKYSCAYAGFAAMYQVAANIGALSEVQFRDCPAQNEHITQQPLGFTIKGSAALCAALDALPKMFRVEPFVDASEFDVFAPGVNKMTALQRLLGGQGIALADCVAFGDGSNDLEMIAAVGMGFAMGNACPQLKKIAAHICLPTWEDGIYNALKEINAI